MTMINVRDFGATGNGVTDDRLAIQNAIAAAQASAGATVFFPSGTYIVGQNGGNAYCLSVSGAVRLLGESRGAVILKQKASIAVSVRLVSVTGNDASLSDLTLDGNKSAQTVNDQRHGIFATTTERLSLERVTARNFTGDGFTLFTNANRTAFVDCCARDNDRNGITMNGATADGCSVVGCNLIGNAAQQFDVEPGGPIYNILIANSYMASVNNDYAVAVGGLSQSARTRGVSLVNNVISGGVYLVWADDAVVADNVIRNSTTKPCITVYRSCRNVSISANTVTATQTSVANVPAIHVFGTAGDHDLEGITLTGNNVLQSFGSADGIYIEGFLDASVSSNRVRGAGTVVAGYSGIRVRATIAATAVRSIRILGNYVSNFGSWGVSVAGNGAARIQSVDISHNTFDSTVASVMPAAIDFDVDGQHAAQNCTAVGNDKTGNVGTMIAGYPTTALLIGGQRGERGIYSVQGTPETVLVEAIGAMALRRDGGSGTSLYVKESGAGNTGWQAK